jgi:hypothetical protein
MSVRIFCKCGTEVTSEVSLWDRKTRSVFWMDQNAPSCSACLKRPMPAARNARTPNPRVTVVGTKAAAC